MIKRNHYIVPIVVITYIIFILFDEEIIFKDDRKKPVPAKSHVAKSVPLKIEGKKVVGASRKTRLENIKVVNRPSSEWKSSLEKTLRAQGGDSIKEIALESKDSFIWVQDRMARHVESVIVTVKNDKNEQSSFRVLVDAQSGKILMNWDQPVVDPVNPKTQGYRIQLDPRYHSND